MTAVPKMMFTTVAGLTLHHALEGAATGLPLVFINSLGSDLRLWHGVTGHFAGQFPIIRYDKRGHGLSDSPPGPYSIQDHTGDLIGLLHTLGVAQAVLVGASVGGLIALDLAHRYPERVQALVLCDTAAKIGTAPFWQERITAIETEGMTHMAAIILSRWFAPTFAARHPAVYQGYYNLLSRVPLSGYLATCAALRDADLTGVLGSITAPALVLCGAEDTATPPALVRGLADALPQAQFDLILQAGHTPPVEQPEALAARILRFLQEFAWAAAHHDE